MSPSSRDLIALTLAWLAGYLAGRPSKCEKRPEDRSYTPPADDL